MVQAVEEKEEAKEAASVEAEEEREEATSVKAEEVVTIVIVKETIIVKETKIRRIKVRT